MIDSCGTVHWFIVYQDITVVNALSRYKTTDLVSFEKQIRLDQNVFRHQNINRCVSCLVTKEIGVDKCPVKLYTVHMLRNLTVYRNI